MDGQRAGCIFCVPARPDASACPAATGAGDTAQLRILLVHPSARGRGAGDRLVSACMDFARSAGYARIRLWTNDVLAAARVVYLRHGFTLAGQDAHRSFGADLVGQVYEARLGQAPAARR